MLSISRRPSAQYRVNAGHSVSAYRIAAVSDLRESFVSETSNQSCKDCSRVWVQCMCPSRSKWTLIVRVHFASMNSKPTLVQTAAGGANRRRTGRLRFRRLCGCAGYAAFGIVGTMPNSKIYRIFSPALAAVPICALLIRHSPEESRDHSGHLRNNLSTKPIPLTGKRRSFLGRR